MSTLVAAPREQVWAALSDAEQVVHWRPGELEPLDADPGYPREGSAMRWRCRLRDLPVVLHETPLSIKPGEHLQARIALGLFRFEQTFTLSAVEEEPEQSRLGLKIAAPNEMPLLGGSLDRFAVREFATDLAATYLQAVRDWCEARRPSSGPFPELPVPLAANAAR